MKNVFLCDKDICTILGVSKSTVTRSARGRRKDALNAVKPIFVGGARRWNKFSVAKALGITVEQLDERLS